MKEVVRPRRDPGPVVNRHGEPPAELYQTELGKWLFLASSSTFPGHARCVPGPSGRSDGRGG